MVKFEKTGSTNIWYYYDASGSPLGMCIGGSSLYPYLYRGYRYDRETGLYYLQSRYYDPETGRFVNADVFASTGASGIACNMFAYCLNDPANLIDVEGTWPSLNSVREHHIQDRIRIPK